MKNSYALSFLALSLVSALACGGSQPAPTSSPTPESTASSSPAASSSAPASAANDAGSPATAGSTATATPAASSSPFFALPDDKKAEVMMTKVVPNVGKLFKERDAKKHAKFGCKTCHGSQKHEDPHNVLPKLTFSNGGYEKLSKSKPEMMKFMSEKVLPTMADALGEKPFDPATKQGFGCKGCHTVD